MEQSLFFILILNDIDRSSFGPALLIPNNTDYRAEAGSIIELLGGCSDGKDISTLILSFSILIQLFRIFDFASNLNVLILQISYA